jgi:hypothetical protein
MRIKGRDVHDIIGRIIDWDEELRANSLARARRANGTTSG